MNDALARREALNPTQSFIVQAPAGSGKTELLTQRFLSLLAQTCQTPEEIIAITFTRKAAAEMRERILESLELAQEPTPPSASHKKLTWELGQEVLKKNKNLHWGLLQNPQRLKIITIDSLCHQLTNRLPLLAGYGANIQTTQSPKELYQKAIREYLIHYPPIELLSHLDNDLSKLTELFIDLLTKRDQWLPYVLADNSESLRQKIEKGLALLAQETLMTAEKLIPLELKNALWPLLSFAGKNLQNQQSLHLLTQWADQTNFPNSLPQKLGLWQGLAQAFITLEGQWRKKINIQLGFPPNTPEKKAFLDILNLWQENETLKRRFQQIIQCPPIHYTDAQWHIIHKIIEALTQLVAELKIIFKQKGLMDFVELGISASEALGAEQDPTDLALALDYQIRHLLIDEFQDTSVSQFKLIEKLLWGWEPGDGRSIFLVGDPMQSIYRFRNAEVGLFLRTAHQGIQNIQLIPLTLSLNFRSDARLIHWFNQNFPKILPPSADPDSGAVPYTPVCCPSESSGRSTIRCYTSTDQSEQAQRVIQIIQQIHEQHPQDQIAILVRSRSYLPAIIAGLQKACIPFQAMDTEPLTNRSEIQDLLALTRGMLHRADRIAWLAILRSPYCGLTLHDCHAIAQEAQRQTIYQVLLNYTDLSGLSEEGYQRLQRIVPVLSQALSNQGRQSLAEWVEETWLTLGGPAALSHSSELFNTQSFFKLLMEVKDLNTLTQKLQELHAAPQTSEGAYLQIMTIHKAKGLEFDHVILPELQHNPATNDPRLLLWAERTSAWRGSHLILAPIKETSADDDPMYVYLKEIEKQKLMQEARRLLYVATTRAKQTLHLLAVLPAENKDSWNPPKNSFLDMLWPYFSQEWRSSDEAPTSTRNLETQRGFRRLVADWKLPEHVLIKPKTVSSKSFAHQTILPLDMKSAWIGTVIHEGLAYLAELAPHFPEPIPIKLWERRLRQLGIPEPDLEAALSVVLTALRNTLKDPRGLWILSAHHEARQNEYALSAKLHGRIIHVILDRTFIDNEGIRWIIDYKTGEGDLSGYHTQLTLYAQVMALHDPRPIRAGIYFPLSETWHEVLISRDKNLPSHSL